MNQIQSMNHSIVLIATALDLNKVHSILLTPHVFGLQLELLPPTKSDRTEILQKIISRDRSLSTSEDVQLDEIVCVLCARVVAILIDRVRFVTDLLRTI